MPESTNGWEEAVFGVLGPLQVVHRDREIPIGAAKERVLLATLLLEAGQVVALDRLVDDLWGDSPPQQPVSSVRVLVSRLRRTLAEAGCEDLLRTVPPGYLLALEPDQLDAARFVRLAADGASLLAAGDPHRASAVLHEALSLWRGEPLADVDIGVASLPNVRRLHDEYLSALEHRIDADLRCGRHAAVAGELQGLVGQHPLRENLWRMLVLSLARSGRHAEALRQAVDYRKVVSDVGLEPSPAFVALEGAVASHAPEVDWRPEPRAATAVTGRAPLPRVLAGGRPSRVVGRGAEVNRLLGILDGVIDGESATAFVSGEPGVGKTTLVAELAAKAWERGAMVLFGRCDEDFQIAFQPFREALQGYLGALPEGAAEAVLERWPRLGRLAGPFGDRFDAAKPLGADAEGERALLFESVEGWLEELAGRGPVVVVIDDLHWAGAPTIQLLRHLSHQKWWPLLCIATFRDTETPGSSPLTAMLGGVHRQPNIHRLSLQGLDRAGVAQLVESRRSDDGTAEDDDDVRLVERIHEETGGNPFFATQLIRHLLESGVEADGWVEQFQLPDGVRDVIRHRVERLSPMANQVLRVAATIGATSPVTLLAAVLRDGDSGSLLDALDEVTAARLLVETPDADFVFAHALVRKTVYGTLSAARRRHLHRSVGEALLALPTPLPDQTVALAYHFCQCAGPGEGARGAHYALLAGMEALDQVAHEMAIEQFARGLHVLARYGPPDRAIEADLHLGIAEACNRTNDHHGRSRAAWKAAAAAREIGSADRLARAAFWVARFGVVGSLDPDVVALCEEALSGLGPEPSAIKARVTAVLASLRALSGEGIDADPIAVEAVEIAADAGDPVAMVEALDARVTTLSGGPDVQLRLQVSAEMITIARRINDLSSLGNGHRFRAGARLISGDRAGFDEDFQAMTQLGERMRDGFLRAISAQWRATVALLDGRFADVEAYAGEAVELSSHDLNFVNAWAAQLLWLRHEQGRMEEFTPLLEAAVADNPGIVGFRAALAMAYATLDRPSDAQRLLRAILAGQPHPIPHDWIRTASLTLCAEAAALLGDVEAAIELERLLAPFGGQLVLVATGTHCQGAVDRFRGMMAWVQGDQQRAEGWLSSALVLEEKARAAPNTARTRLWYARTLATTGDNPELAAEFAREAAVTARRLGMHEVLSSAEKLLGQLGPRLPSGRGHRGAPPPR